MMLLGRVIATLISATAMIVLGAVLAGVECRFAALRAGVAPPPWRQPWVDLVALSRKRRLRPGFASPWYSAWPVVALAASGAAALIVPGFAFGTITAALATVPMLAGLLGLAVGARLAALLESGAGARGLAASDAALRLLAGGAVWLAAFGVLAVRAGSVRLEAIGGVIALMPGAAPLVVLAGLAAVLTLGCFSLDEPGDYAGPERALWRLEAMLRRAVMLAALVDLVAAGPMVDAMRVTGWPGGLVGWAGAMLALGAVVLWVAPRRLAVRLGALCAALAVAVLVVETVDGATLSLVAGAVIGLGGLVWRGDAAAWVVQVGIALIGFGLGADRGAALILAVAVLARLAWLAAGSGWVARLSVIALVGLPPFAGFAGDFAVVRAGFAADRWVGGLVLGLWGVLVVLALLRLPPVALAPTGEKRGRGVVPAAIGLVLAVGVGLVPGLIAGAV